MIRKIISLTLIVAQCSILLGKSDYKRGSILKLTKEDKIIKVNIKKETILITYNDVTSNSEKKEKIRNWLGSKKEQKLKLSKLPFSGYAIPMGEIKSIQLGEGNKALKYGLIDGVFNLLLFYNLGVFDGENESNSGQNQNWPVPFPVQILMGITLFSPTLLPALFGLSVPNGYSEPMMINGNEWKIILE